MTPRSIVLGPPSKAAAISHAAEEHCILDAKQQQDFRKLELELAAVRAQLARQQDLTAELQMKLLRSSAREGSLAPHSAHGSAQRSSDFNAFAHAAASAASPAITPDELVGRREGPVAIVTVGPACDLPRPPDVIELLAATPEHSSSEKLRTVTPASLEAACTTHGLSVQVVVLAPGFPINSAANGANSTWCSGRHLPRDTLKEAIAQRKTAWVSKAFCNQLELPWPAEKALKLINNVNPSAVRSSINGFLKNMVNGCFTPCAFRIVVYHAQGPTELVTSRYFPCYYQDDEGVRHMAFVVQLDGRSADFKQRAYRGTMLDLLALKYMPCLVTMVNAQGQALFQNSASHEELGVLAGESLLNGLWPLQPSDSVNYLKELFADNEAAYAEMLERTATGGTFMRRVKMKSRSVLCWMGVSGCEVWHEVQVARAKDPMTREVVYIIAQWDVTDAVVAQRQVQALQRQAQELLGEILPQQVVDVLLGNSTAIVAACSTPHGRNSMQLMRSSVNNSRRASFQATRSSARPTSLGLDLANGGHVLLNTLNLSGTFARDDSASSSSCGGAGSHPGSAGGSPPADPGRVPARRTPSNLSREGYSREVLSAHVATAAATAAVDRAEAGYLAFESLQVRGSSRPLLPFINLKIASSSNRPKRNNTFPGMTNQLNGNNLHLTGFSGLLSACGGHDGASPHVNGFCTTINDGSTSRLEDRVGRGDTGLCQDRRGMDGLFNGKLDGLFGSMMQSQCTSSRSEGGGSNDAFAKALHGNVAGGGSSAVPDADVGEDQGSMANCTCRSSLVDEYMEEVGFMSLSPEPLSASRDAPTEQDMHATLAAFELRRLGSGGSAPGDDSHMDRVIAVVAATAAKTAEPGGTGGAGRSIDLQCRSAPTPPSATSASGGTANAIMLVNPPLSPLSAAGGSQTLDGSRPSFTKSISMRRETISELATFHDEVTVLFTDIVQFTSMSQQLHPAQVMLFLNQVFGVLDTLTEVHKVYKVETIGDCYMVAGGLFEYNEDGSKHLGGFDPYHAERVVAFAKDMVHEVSKLTTPLGDPVRMRVGCHSGACMSGVVGRKMPRFCLFGDTINTASRMESTGQVGCIHVSKETYDLVPDEAWIPTGGVEAKGKGILETYLLDVL